MDDDGRVTIPKPTRELLGIDGSEAILRMDIEVREVVGGE